MGRRSPVLRKSNEEKEGQGYRHTRSRDSADQRRILRPRDSADQRHLLRSRDGTELIQNTTRDKVVSKGRKKRGRAPDLNGDEYSENGNGDTRPECPTDTSRSTARKGPRRNVVPDTEWKCKVSDSKTGREGTQSDCSSGNSCSIRSMDPPPNLKSKS